MDGILNLNKPPGSTSFNVVARVRRLSGERRVGHAGTLDPAASGVLPVCLGQGTRVTEFLQDLSKTYQAQIELGVTTDTYDTTGEITQRRDPSAISRRQFELALDSFRGLIWQIPPMYSAVKYHGSRLYQLARAGISVDRKRRLAKVYRLEFIDWQPPVATIEVECGKGTYLRSLAHDLGQSLGCGASLKNLIRLSYGPFDIKDALSLPQLEEAFNRGYWRRFLHSTDSVLHCLSAIIVDNVSAHAIRNGQPWIPNINGESMSNHGSGTSLAYSRVYSAEGDFLAILRHNPERRQWQPQKVFL